ncbi:TetR/AcrR family transcriptional regulator [Kutzneria sp. NPDC051319]|uniref:TetR/AcrR family transcriptional regulator n=1 Tax=Kutzneria sp. NPDC051319 TaxID=3155047 RepID=UPI0034122CF5
MVTRTHTATSVDFRRRLLDAMTAAIDEIGYRDTTVADVVRLARTSRRTFYEHFASKESCYVALVSEANDVMIARITAAVDPARPWSTQVRQAVEEWLACSDAERALTHSWIRDIPALGTLGRQLQRDLMEKFIDMVQSLTDRESLRARGIHRVDRQMAILLLGGLRELIASNVEDGGQATDITETAVRASIALLGP